MDEPEGGTTANALEWRAHLLWLLLPAFAISIALFTVLDRLGWSDPATASPRQAMILVVVALVQVLTLIATVTLTAMWLHRANANLRARGIEMAFTPAGAWGWYFVPIINLFKPFQAMKEIWNASLHQGDSFSAAADPLLRQWWGCWIVGNMATSLAVRIAAIGGSSVAALLDAAGVIALAAAAFLLARIVRTVTEAQRGVSAAEVFA